MPVDWTAFVEFVHTHSSFLLMTHRRPDGDGIGSQFALADALRRLNKDVLVTVLERFPPRYRFLNPDEDVAIFDPDDTRFHAPEAIIILDTGTRNQLEGFADFLTERPRPTVVIDHHQTQDPIGTLQLVDTDAEATGRLVHEAIMALEVGHSERSAMALFTALTFDTGWFRHSNTTPRTFELARQLTEAGANPNQLSEALFDHNSLQRLKVMEAALGRITRAADGRIALTEIHQSDLERTGAGLADTEDLINLPRSLAGVQVAAILTEQPDGSVRLSLRSRQGIDVGGVAESFGGGGHRVAAGASDPGPIAETRQRLLDALMPLVQPPA